MLLWLGNCVWKREVNLQVNTYAQYGRKVGGSLPVLVLVPTPTQ